MNKTLGVVVGEPPKALQHARLDNIVLVPASLLPLKGTYQPLANILPKGSILLVANASPRQKRILEKIAAILSRRKQNQRVEKGSDKLIRKAKTQSFLHQHLLENFTLSASILK